MMFVIYLGASAAFYQGDILNLKEDLKLVKPTIFVTVPRMLKIMEESFTSNIEALSKIPRAIMKRAIDKKLEELETNGKITHKIYDKILLGRFRDSLGGCVKWILTGSAALPQSTEKFLQVVLSAPIIQGYGLTESTGAIFTKNLEDHSAGHVGGPSKNIEFKLADVPEWDYRTSESDLSKSIKGEILLRGPGLFKGYYLQPERKPDEWFHTGDVAEITASGRLRIIDRIKNICKLANGEKVSFEKLENLYSKCSVVDEIYVDLSSNRAYLIAIVVPNKNEIFELSKNKGLVHQNYDELVGCDLVKNYIVEALLNRAKETNLFEWEKIININCSSRSFQELGLLSSNMKFKRYEASKVFKEILEKL